MFTSVARPSRLRSYYGTEVSGDHFWPRPEIVDPLVASLKSGQSHTLFGLRRIGKSSVMLEVERRLTAEGVVVSRVKVEGDSGLEGLFGQLLRNLPAPDLKSKLLRGIETAKGMAEPVLATARSWLETVGVQVPEKDLNAYWPVLSRALCQGFEAHRQPIVLIIDELPFLIQNTIEKAPDSRGAAAARNILSALRDWRTVPHVAILVAGSIGLRGLALRHKLDPGAFNDMMAETIPPLALDEARLMLCALVAGHTPSLSGWNDACTETLLQGVPDYHAGLLQLAFLTAALRGAATPAAIEDALLNHFEPKLTDQFFSQFDHRLQREVDPMRGHLVRAIDAVVDAREAGLGIDALHDLLTKAKCEYPDEVARLLQEEGFLTFNRHSRTLRPASRLVSAWRDATPRVRR